MRNCKKGIQTAAFLLRRASTEKSSFASLHRWFRLVLLNQDVSEELQAKFQAGEITLFRFRPSRKAKLTEAWIAYKADQVAQNK